jgi:hypothetical protein
MNPTWELWREQGVKYYLAISAGGLGLVFLLLHHRGVSFAGTYVPLLVGAAGGAAVWSRAPLAYLISLAVAISLEPNRFMLSARSGGGVWIVDVLLCVGTLAYMASQYRLQGLLKGVFPTVPQSGQDAAAALQGTRSRHGTDSRSAPQATPTALTRFASPVARRAVGSVTPREVGTLLLLLPVWAVLAEFLAVLLPTSVGNPDIHRPAVWRAMTLVWMLAVIGFVLAGILDYYYRRHMSAAEATLYLQDLLWKETRREQRRIQRWRAWARLGCPRLPLGRFMEVVGLIAEIVAIIVLPFIFVFLVWVVTTWFLRTVVGITP